MIIGCWGEDKSCKTTFALTFPKPLIFMEFDIGGFQRAIYRFQQEFDQGLIRYEAYPLPITFGSFNPDEFDPSQLSVKPSKIIIGMKELFYQWATAYVKHLRDPEVKSIVIDTETLRHKTVTSDAYLQELQEKQMPLRADGLGKDGKALRTQLLQIEYREPNTRTRGVYYNAKAAGKHLILVHHAQPEYKPMPQRDGTIANAETGKRERSGFSTLGDSADIILQNYWDLAKQKPFAKVELAEVKTLEGMVVEEPSYDKLDKLVKMMKGIPTQ